jgi:N-acyl-D-aspartate/D-glutamate deacylase
MTASPAKRFSLRDRGVIAVGAIADLVVFDAATVLDRATYEQPLLTPIGVPDVVMAGQRVIANSATGRVRAGAVLASGR